jgi:Na+/melibiose symporter-like transporter
VTTRSTSGAALSRGLLLAFTAPTFVLGVMHGPEGQIQSIYAKHGGVALTALALALLLTKIFDAVTYPLIGWLSDVTYARHGTRKGWVVAGTAVSVLGMWQLMHPPAAVDAVYFGIWFAMLYVGWKLMEIPLQAWSYGLSEDYAERTRVQAWRGLVQIAGTLLFFVIPFLAVRLGVSDSAELDFRSLGLSAVICTVALPLAALAAIRFVPDGVAPPPVKPKRPSWAEIRRALIGNRPLLHLLAAFAPFSFVTGMMVGVGYLYVDAYLGVTEQYPVIMLLALVASVIGIPIWSALAKRWERHRVLALAFAFSGVISGVFALATPGPLATPLMFVLYPSVMFCMAAIVLVYAISADIVDHGRAVTGEDHAGLYGSILQFLIRSVQGVAGAVGLALVGMSGFDATAPTQTAMGVLGIKLIASVIPALGMLGAAAIVWTFPLSRARIAEIQLQLHQAKPASD